jgi:hypothetical protein
MSHGSSRASSLTTSPTPRVWVPRHVALLITRLVAPLVVDYFAYAARPGASACRAARHAAHHRLLCLSRASVCLGMSRSSSRGLSQDSSSTTSPRSTSSSNTSHTARVRVRRHVARLVTQLVVDYLAALRSSSHGSSRRSSPTIPPCKGLSSTTSPMSCVRVPGHVARLVVDYFAYAARPCVPARRVAHRRLLRLRRASSASARLAARLAARRRLFRVRCASGCLNTSRGSSCGSSSPTLCAATSSHGNTCST